MGTDGNMKLADFGASKYVGEIVSDFNVKSIVGTPFWMAPDVVRAGQSGNDSGYDGFKADIWSVGCVVVEMLTGEHPYADVNQFAAVFRISEGVPPSYPNTLSDEGKDFLAKCFLVDPVKRPSAAELLEHPFVKKKHLGKHTKRSRSFTSGAGKLPHSSSGRQSFNVGLPPIAHDPESESMS